MKRTNITRVTLNDIEQMKARGEVYHNPNAPVGESLGADFWAKAVVVKPQAPQPVLLKIDPEVLAFFKSQGKGHLTRMQDVLKAYVNAHRHS